MSPYILHPSVHLCAPRVTSPTSTRAHGSWRWRRSARHSACRRRLRCVEREIALTPSSAVNRVRTQLRRWNLRGFFCEGGNCVVVGVPTKLGRPVIGIVAMDDIVNLDDVSTTQDTQTYNVTVTV